VDLAGELFVPYCDRCLRHASAGATRALAATLASLLVAVTLALGVSLVWPHASLASQVGLCAIGACLPLLVRAVGRAPRSPHTARERAVWWRRDGTLACTHPRFAEALARQTGTEAPRAAKLREVTWTPWMAAGPVIAVIAGASTWYLEHPLMRVINLSDARLTIEIDDRVVAVVDPTSAESPAAGSEIRVPAGARRLVAKGPAGPIADARVTLEAGATHLYAPGSDGFCFWLEQDAYGRAEVVSGIEPLAGDLRLWVLPRRIDTWFAPNPPATEDRRSSGGSLVALRQARCDHAPPGVRTRP
jgi:hypothetical protein